MEEYILSLKNYGIAFGNKEVLNDVTVDIPVKGALVLVGPAGTGKSTLLRTLSGINNASPSLRTWGEANYLGEPLGMSSLPVIVSQHNKLVMASIRENIVCELPERQSLTLSQQRDICARLLQSAGLDDLINHAEDSVISLPLGIQRHLAIVRKIAANPKLIMIDEPTADIEQHFVEKILHYLVSESQRRCVLVVVHNQKHARVLGGHTALLAAGTIQELQTTEDFFTKPLSQPAKDFARTGSCCVKHTVARKSPLLHSDAPQTGSHTSTTTVEKFISHAFGPRNFYWLKQGKLAGTPRPGLIYDLDYDLKALQRVGIRVLISLTTQPVDTEALERFGIIGIAFPIEDMGCPEINAALALCEQVNQYINAAEPVAIHCRAGMGRTGTMLAAQLIWEGNSALDAIETARRIEPRWIQSDVQIQFLQEFHITINNRALPKQ